MTGPLYIATAPLLSISEKCVRVRFHVLYDLMSSDSFDLNCTRCVPVLPEMNLYERNFYAFLMCLMFLMYIVPARSAMQSYVSICFICFFYEDYVIDGSHNLLCASYYCSKFLFVCFALCAAHPSTPKITRRRHKLSPTTQGDVSATRIYEPIR